MIKQLSIVLAIVSLVGCTTAPQPLRLSDQHQRNLDDTINHSLLLQECVDRLQGCKLDTCMVGAVRLSKAKVSYDQMMSWMNICVGYCMRREMSCLAK